MSDVLRNLQEFRKEKEKEKAKLRGEEHSAEVNTENVKETIVKNKSADGQEWNFLTKSDPVPEDYEEKSVVSTRIAIAVYVVGQALAAWVQFGAVFFILSLILFTYWNTGRRRHGEMSAYSVFNENCERLAGSMTAEHFERDMLRQRR